MNSPLIRYKGKASAVYTVQETDVSCAGVRVDLKRLAQFLHGEQLHPEVPYSVQ
jgi:hypothetical protein